MGLGIVVALPQEARCLLRRKPRVGELCAISNEDQVLVSGVGAMRARDAAVVLLERGATVLVSWGTAVGLDPSVSTGTLVLPEKIIASDQRNFCVDHRLHSVLFSKLKNELSIRSGDITDVSDVLCNPLQKQKLFKVSNAMGADMESAAVAAISQEAKIPFLAVRTILDTANDELPLWITEIVDDKGRLRLFRLVRHAFVPRDLIVLVRISTQLRIACHSLSIVAKNLTVLTSA